MSTPNHRLQQLRQELTAINADYFYVPAADPHKNEYVPEHWQRRTWISQFTGSAGDALIGKEQAFLWTDARYFLQAELELDEKLFQLMKLQTQDTPNFTDFISQQSNITLAIDPKVVSIKLAKELQQCLTKQNSQLLCLDNNLIDAIWQDQPALPQGNIHLHDTKYAGQSHQEKIKKVRTQLKKHQADTLVINSLEAIAWLFNIRGNDIAYNPLTIANAIITDHQATLFVDAAKLSPEVNHYFQQNHITIEPYTIFGDALQQQTGLVWLDPNHCNLWIEQQLTQAQHLYKPSPIQHLKAIKNQTEQDGMREAHRLDAIAVITFLHWLENNWKTGVTEVSAEQHLNQLRLDNPNCVDLSFNTISGFAEHGAIIHYAASPKTDIAIDDSSLYLVDSGGQYPMGTTDITRTIHLGIPTAQQKQLYTLVLKGHLAIAMSVFPHGTCGEHINAFAHAPLWQHGLDYSHGTGHGVGCYACVHQFPPMISSHISNIPFEPGMVVSNEPGVYLDGKFGIRIENLCLTVKQFSRSDSPTKHGPFYAFETLTLVPYARNLIDTHLLTQLEVNWIDQYHQRVYKLINPKISDKSVHNWLKSATAPLLQ